MGAAISELMATLEHMKTQSKNTAAEPTEAGMTLAIGQLDTGPQATPGAQQKAPTVGSTLSEAERRQKMVAQEIERKRKIAASLGWQWIGPIQPETSAMKTAIEGVKKGIDHTSLDTDVTQGGQ
jgi:hypothetical protein